MEKQSWIAGLIVCALLGFLLPTAVMMGGGTPIYHESPVGYDPGQTAVATFLVAAFLAILAMAGAGICAAGFGQTVYCEEKRIIRERQRRSG